MSNENAVRNLIRIDDKSNPTFFRAIQLLIDDLYKINNEVFPIVTPGQEQGSVGGLVLPAPLNFQGVAYPDNLRLDWDDLQGAFRYQIRIGRLWDTAKHVLTTATDMANVDPVYLNLIYGTYNFLLRGMNANAALGDTAEAVLVIPQIPPPDLFVEVMLSTVLLRWTEPASSWRIHHYIIYKDGLEIGTISGTFKLIQEQIGGTYSYAVAAVDIVGNVSTRSAVKTVELHDPSEYEFIEAVYATYDGVKVNIVEYNLEGIHGLLGPIVDDKTWEEHYVVYGWDSPFAQIEAGYPIYMQPTEITGGTYTEKFDFGEVRRNIKIVVDYNKYQITGYTDIQVEIRYSIDDITWSEWFQGNTVLASEFRYAEITLRFINIDDKALVHISNLMVSLNVILIIDSGAAVCLASDVGGTLVAYTKEYTGISSVTAITSTSLQPLYVVCDQVTKDDFRALVFDSSGNRANANINWKSRGIV